MEYRVSEVGSYQRVLELTWSADEVRGRFQEKLVEYREKLVLPGFRPGKAPLGLIKSRFGDIINSELSETLLKEGYQEVLEKTGLKPINEGKVDILSEIGEDRPFKVKLELEVKPKIKLLKYKGYKVKKRRKKITADDVNREVSALREKVVTLEKAERNVIRAGDVVVADVIDDGTKREKVVFDLTNEWTGRLFKALVGMRLGEKKTLEIEYPEDYPSEELRATKRLVKLSVRKIFKKKYPRTKKALLEKLGGRFQTYPQLLREIRSQLERKAEKASVMEMEESVVDQLLKDNPVEPPPSLVQIALSRFISAKYNVKELTAERYNQISEELRPLAERAIARELILEAIAEAEGLEISDDEFNSWLSSEAVKLGTTTDMLRELLEEKGQLNVKKEELLQRKALEFVLANSEIIEEEVV